MKDFRRLIELRSLAYYFSKEEIAEYSGDKKMRSLAARYLIKNILKQNVFNDLSYQDIMILNEASGKPKLFIKSREENDFVHISITHSQVRASALVLIETRKTIK